MTAQVKTGTRLDRRDLATQVGNGPRGAGVGSGREQPDDPVLADQIARRIKALRADVVEIYPPMHAGVDVRLRDDERARLLQERHDLRRDLQQFIATLEHAQLSRTHDAKSTLKLRLEGASVESVVAHAEKGEIICEQPLQELNCFGDLVNRQWRRIGFHLGDYRNDAIAHCVPVLDRHPHFTEQRLQRTHEIAAGVVVHDLKEMKVDETFPILLRSRRTERNQFAALAPHADDRMRDEAHIEMALRNLTRYRIDQEGHVIVDNLDHRNCLATAGGRERHGFATYFWPAWSPLGHKVICAFGERSEIFGAIAPYVFGHGPAVKLRDKRARDVEAAAGKLGARLVDHGARCAFFLTGGKLGDHGTSSLFKDQSRQLKSSSQSHQEQPIIW